MSRFISQLHKKNVKKKLKKKLKKKMNDEHCQKLERNEKTAERQTKGNDEYGSPEQKFRRRDSNPGRPGALTQCIRLI